MSYVIFGLCKIDDDEFGEWPLDEHNVVEVELGPTVDFGGVEGFVRYDSDEAVKMVELLLEFRLLTPHIIKTIAQLLILITNYHKML